MVELLYSSHRSTAVCGLEGMVDKKLTLGHYLFALREMHNGRTAVNQFLI